ncbi:MAG: M61 family metallopeptidase [Thermoplasmatota archaeon]
MPAAPTLRYELSMRRPRTHRFEVTLRFEVGAGRVVLRMPTWTPGSYLIREFARNVEDVTVRWKPRVTARTRPLGSTRLDKSGWAFEMPQDGFAEVSYEVYAHELSVQTSHLDDTHGYVNGASVFLYPEGMLHLPCEITVQAPNSWHVDTGLRVVPPGRSPRRGRRGADTVFRADDYDHLADCPIEIGTHARATFTVAGKRHRIALYGAGNADVERLRRDLRTIVGECARLFGGLPYDEYLFIIHLTSGSGKDWGGLEHRNSTTLLAHRFSFRPAKEYDRFLSLAAHEFFHTWNVKRVKPASFIPYDWQNETYTRLLWAMEGITSYYDGLILARTGLRSGERAREELADDWKKLQEQPGRHLQSVEESSLTTWVKFYRQDENYINTGISYYLKGSLVGCALDLAIRERTQGRRSLDDVMRFLWRTYVHDRNGDVAGLPEDVFGQALRTVTGKSFADFLSRYVSGTEDPPLVALLRTVGWDLKPVVRGKEKDGRPEKPAELAGPGAHLGATVEDHNGRVIAKSILRDSPAETMGLAPGDEIVALNGWRATADGMRHRLAEAAPGDAAKVTIFRRETLRTLTGRLGPLPPDSWRITAEEHPSAAQKRALEAWLGKASRPTAVSAAPTKARSRAGPNRRRGVAKRSR